MEKLKMEKKKKTHIQRKSYLFIYLSFQVVRCKSDFDAFWKKKTLLFLASSMFVSFVCLLHTLPVFQFNIRFFFICRFCWFLSFLLSHSHHHHNHQWIEMFGPSIDGLFFWIFFLGCCCCLLSLFWSILFILFIFHYIFHISSLSHHYHYPNKKKRFIYLVDVFSLFFFCCICCLPGFFS